MIDIKEVIAHQEQMRENLIARNISINFDSFLEAYHALRKQKQEIEYLQSRGNEIAKGIKQSLNKSRDEKITEGAQIKKEIAALKEKYEMLSDYFNKLVLELPNWTSPEVSIGQSDLDNQILSIKGALPTFDFTPKDHVDIGVELGLIDFDSGVKVAGSKFYFLKNQLVLLQHAIKSYVFEKALNAGFTPLHTPDIAYNHILQGVGFAPRGEESNTYQLQDTEKSLIATAEICVGGMHSNEIINENDLPILYVAESHCFRKEAGAAGRASKGLYRVHQFEKVELFVICRPEDSEKFHDRLLALQEEIYQGLNIPYRVVLNCSGDLGAPAYKKYDIEAWMPGKGSGGEYGEITSASNCTDYQARRLNIKYKDTMAKKNKYVHTLNGTASALSRTIIAIMENFQTQDGSVIIPEVLRKYLNFEKLGKK